MEGAGASKPKKSSRSIGETLRTGFIDDPVARKVLKATDSADVPPKEKHVAKLLALSHRRDVPVSEFGEALANRMLSNNWVVVLKACVVLHRLLRDGSDRLFGYMSTRSGELQACRFRAGSRSPQDSAFATYVRGLGAYLTHKVVTRRKLGWEYCHASQTDNANDYIAGLAAGEVGTSFTSIMDATDVGLAVVTRAEGVETETRDGAKRLIWDIDTQFLPLSHPLFRASLSLLLKDLLRIYVFANAAAVRLLEQYFKMSKYESAPVYRLYQRYVLQCEVLDEFVQLCRTHNALDGKDIPPLAEAPRRILPTMHKIMDDK